MAAVAVDVGAVGAEHAGADELVVGAAEGVVEHGEVGEEQLDVVGLERHVVFIADLALPGDAGLADGGVETDAEHVDVLRVLDIVVTGGAGGEQTDFFRVGGDGLRGGIERLEAGRQVGRGHAGQRRAKERRERLLHSGGRVAGCDHRRGEPLGGEGLGGGLHERRADGARGRVRAEHRRATVVACVVETKLCVI
ncbi:MAG: hypothetical protein BWX86_02425 [Verrucomicrobia bacterium ADurb.Bin122]|nr:MAG: hypothetical protein BWX86_02425 [Verrucomicrobia bacterium ADurb.Bin122]